MSFIEYAGRYVGCNPQSVGEEAERHIASLDKRIAELEARIKTADDVASVYFRIGAEALGFDEWQKRCNDALSVK